MSQYVALLRLSDHRAGKAPIVRICSALMRLPGVGSVQPDWSSGGPGGALGRGGGGSSLVVFFDRSKVSLGELVRAIEDEGRPVCGVAQSRADAAEPGRLATA